MSTRWPSELNHLIKNEKFIDNVERSVLFRSKRSIFVIIEIARTGNNNKTQSIHASFYSTSYLVGGINGPLIRCKNILNCVMNSPLGVTLKTCVMFLTECQ